MTETLEHCFRRAGRMSLTAAYRDLCKSYYCDVDWLGLPVLRPPEMRPSYHQLRHMFTSLYGSVRELRNRPTYLSLDIRERALRNPELHADAKQAGAIRATALVERELWLMEPRLPLVDVHGGTHEQQVD